ncbi:type II toxin-antitoxin system VapC family toxin [Moheibacter sediminis]|uniref:Predicted nucleic acid-binding protein, contains PIN domain n=1 Tax=Moheibacter sediminis TaxID=1434700 RepID=A0A1W1ZVA1_9FLAO|nr:PIN domain-containing protein [Moheibacter sediminis]SMC52327.1 Predicted nucleic acid-binding protein, contains PIN domain [Moheibacter sediminis]
MKKVFLDTNIIVDLIADRKPFSKYAIEIFQLAEENKLQIFTSSHSIATTHYLLKKYLDEKSLREVLYNLLDFITIIVVDTDIIKKGLRSNYKDFEDAIQILCASSIENINCIITRNGKDFKGSEIPVLSPDEFFLNL